MSRAIVWFRADQRLTDNPALNAACSTANEVLPVIIIDPTQHGPSAYGFARTGKFRRKFITEGFLDLDNELRACGSGLRVEVGDPAEVLERLTRTWAVDRVHAQELYAYEEVAQATAVAERIPLTLHGSNTLLHADDLPFSFTQLPSVFTKFRNKVEAQWSVRDLLHAPVRISTPTDWSSLAALERALPYATFPQDPRGAITFNGGARAARARLQEYLGADKHLSRYKATRNGLLGANYSSKLSPWLASGSLSAREVYYAVKDYEIPHGANESTYWLIFELLWRDFFQFTAAAHGRHLFLKNGMQHKAVKGNTDARRFATWCEGRTGHPFINANMHELAATGWMSNRGRQNVASFLVHDLGIDWRMGASWFEHQLIDYDPCSNWGNWQYVAGVGNDPREGRRFDPDRQSGMYDPQGAYVDHWS